MRQKQNALNLIQFYGLGKRTFYDATRLLISENHKSIIFYAHNLIYCFGKTNSWNQFFIGQDKYSSSMK